MKNNYLLLSLLCLTSIYTIQALTEPYITIPSLLPNDFSDEACVYNALTLASSIQNNTITLIPNDGNIYCYHNFTISGKSNITLQVEGTM
jgi:hypothetical protein